MPGTKHVASTAKHSATTFNDVLRLLVGASGRIRGLGVRPVTGGTAVEVDPGVFIVNGIVVNMTSISSADSPAGFPIPVTGLSPPFGLIATTSSASEATPIVFTVVANFDPNAPRPEAIIGFTDASGQIWTAAAPLGLKEIRDLKVVQQFTDAQVKLLGSTDGNIDDASTEHGHRGLLSDQLVFETLTNLDFTSFPHKPLPRNPVSADNTHTHQNLLTNNELDLLTARNGLQNADSLHLHEGLLTAVQRTTLTGGPLSDASGLHDHFALRQAHGIVANPTATIFYIPQNIGQGDCLVRGLKSSFQGSFKILVGPAATGGAITHVIGIRFKDNARFWQDTSTGVFGDCSPGAVPGVPVTEIEALFLPGSPFGIFAPVPFNTTFTWRGIDIVVKTPVGGRPFDATDYFVVNGVVRNTGPVGQENGSPATFERAHERELSYAGIRLVGVLDPKFREGGVWSIGYS